MRRPASDFAGGLSFGLRGAALGASSSEVRSRRAGSLAADPDATEQSPTNNSPRQAPAEIFTGGNMEGGTQQSKAERQGTGSSKATA